MSGSVIAGKYQGKEVDSDGKGAFINMGFSYTRNINRNTAKSAVLKSSNPNKSMGDASLFRIIWNLILIGAIVIGILFTLQVISFIIGLIIFIFAIILLIVSLVRPKNMGAYQVEIIWKDGEKSLIECDNNAYNKIQEAFYE